MSKIVLLIFAGVLFSTSVAHSQSTESVSDTLQLEDIIITASKLPVSLKETIRPVIVIDQQQIEQSTSGDISQLLHQQSGIRVNNSQSSQGENRSLFLQGAGGEYTLILIDGVAVNDPSGVGGAIDLRLLPLHNIERIEILKGNQSTLYGTDAVAGVINIITKNRSESIINPSGTIEYGAYNSFRGAISVSGNINEKVTYSGGYNREMSDGISAAKSPEGEAPFQKDGFDSNSVYGNVTISPFQRFSIKPFITYSDFSGDYDAGAFQDADNDFSIEMINPGVQGMFESEKVNVQATYQFTKTDRVFTSEYGENMFEGEFQNTDAFITYSPSYQWKFLGGINIQDATIPEDVQLELPQASASFSSPYGKVQFESKSGFMAEAGFRLNNHSEYGTNATYNVAPGFQVSESIKLFASAGSAFRAPTLSQLFGQFGANPDLEPETSVNYQAGAEVYFSENRVKVEMNYFRRDIENLIAYGQEGYLNRDEQNVSGAELSTNWVVNPNVQLGFFYNYVTGETITLDENGETVSDTELLRKPTHNLGMNVSYNFNNGLRLKADVEHAGERNDLFFNPETFVSESVTLDSYLLANIYAGYGFFDNQFTIFTTVRNIFNADFSEVYGYNTLGLHAKAGVRFSL